MVSALGPAMLLLWLGAGAATPASEEERLVREGETLGKNRQYQGALERFWAAERALPDPLHACWLAVSYLRLGRAADAGLLVARCKSAPEERRRKLGWAEAAEEQIRRELEKGKYAEIDVSSEPSGAELQASTLDPALSVRTPARLWLPLGKTELVVKHPGFIQRQIRIDLITKGLTPVVVSLEAAPVEATAKEAAPAEATKEAQARPPSPTPAPLASVVPAPQAPPPLELVAQPALERPPARSAALPWLAVGSSAVALGFGVGLYAEAVSSSSKAGRVKHEDGSYVTMDEATFATRSHETAAWISYGVSAIALGVGLWLFGAESP